MTDLSGSPSFLSCFISLPFVFIFIRVIVYVVFFIIIYYYYDFFVRYSSSLPSIVRAFCRVIYPFYIIAPFPIPSFSAGLHIPSFIPLSLLVICCYLFSISFYSPFLRLFVLFLLFFSSCVLLTPPLPCWLSLISSLLSFCFTFLLDLSRPSSHFLCSFRKMFMMFCWDVLRVLSLLS